MVCPHCNKHLLTEILPVDLFLLFCYLFSMYQYNFTWAVCFSELIGHLHSAHLNLEASKLLLDLNNLFIWGLEWVLLGYECVLNNV